MYKDVEKQKMTNEQLYNFAYQTAQWWNAVFIQSKRFFDALDDNNGKLPWEEGNDSIFIAERLFLITAIYHAIENLQKLDIELQRENDSTLEAILSLIENVVPFEDIKNMRNMNEHALDYQLEKGRRQDKYYQVTKEGAYNINTTANMTFAIGGDVPIMLFGNVKINKLLTVMKEQYPKVLGKMEEVFMKNFRTAILVNE